MKYATTESATESGISRSHHGPDPIVPDGDAAWTLVGTAVCAYKPSDHADVMVHYVWTWSTP